MSCTRCHGLMLEEHMIDMEAAYGEMWSVSARCINCGHRDDVVIQRHRRLSAKQVMATIPVHGVAADLHWNSKDVDLLAA